MKTFEMPMIEVITFTAESIMDSGTGNGNTEPLPTGNNMLPWG